MIFGPKYTLSVHRWTGPKYTIDYCTGKVPSLLGIESVIKQDPPDGGDDGVDPTIDNKEHAGLQHRNHQKKHEKPQTFPFGLEERCLNNFLKKVFPGSLTH